MDDRDIGSAISAVPGIKASVSRLLAVCIGNGLEFYDFGAYALFAVYIGRAFFPTRSGSLSLLLSVATLGIGFVTRPLGALVLGPLGDRLGRRRAMLLSFLLMGVGTLTLALTPSFARIGLAAPVLLVLSRLVQGFAVGGDIGPTTAYMVEVAPLARRGLYGSMQLVSQQAGVLVASLVAFALTQALPGAALAAWGWRVAFFLGVVILPFGVLLRYRLPETLVPGVASTVANAETPRLRPYRRLIVCVLVIMAGNSIGAYVLAYLTSYALATLHMAPTRAFGIPIVRTLCEVVGLTLSGWISDRIGRRPVMRLAFALTALLVMPSFIMMTHHPSSMQLYATISLLGICFAFRSPYVAALTEALPPAIRSGVVGITYAIVVAIFGGTAQFTVTWLIRSSGSALAPAWYWTAAMLLGLIGALYIPETAPRFTRPFRALKADPAGLAAIEKAD